MCLRATICFPGASISAEKPKTQACRPRSLRSPRPTGRGRYEATTLEMTWPTSLSYEIDQPILPDPPRSISVPDPRGRACCDMQCSTSRRPNRLLRSFSARAGSTNVLTDLPAAWGDGAKITYVDHSRFPPAAELFHGPTKEATKLWRPR